MIINGVPPEQDSNLAQPPSKGTADCREQEKLHTPLLSDLSFFCKEHQFKKNLHSNKSPSFTPVCKELDDFGTFITV